MMNYLDQVDLQHVCGTFSWLLSNVERPSPLQEALFYKEGPELYKSVENKQANNQRYVLFHFFLTVGVSACLSSGFDFHEIMDSDLELKAK